MDDYVIQAIRDFLQEDIHDRLFNGKRLIDHMTAGEYIDYALGRLRRIEDENCGGREDE
jgi:hypothetical protein